MIIVLLFEALLKGNVSTGLAYAGLPDGLRQIILTPFSRAGAIESLMAGLEMSARWDVLLALLIGAIGGAVIGAIRGVGAAAAFAILRSASFSLNLMIPPLSCVNVNSLRNLKTGGMRAVNLRPALPRLKAPQTNDPPIAMAASVPTQHLRALVKEWRTHPPDEDHDLHHSQTR